MVRGWHPPEELSSVEHPSPRLIDDHFGVRKQWAATWYDPPFLPDARFVDQVYGICFDETGSILLVNCPEPDGDYWNLPGGGLEPGESFEDCLVREVSEEACATVTNAAYLGCQRVDEYDERGSINRCCYQLRYWARVDLQTWAPRHETTARKTVHPEDFLATLAWGQARTASLILEKGLLEWKRARYPERR